MSSKLFILIYANLLTNHNTSSFFQQINYFVHNKLKYFKLNVNIFFRAYQN